MMGDAGTGKTALVSQFMTSEYMHTYDASLGAYQIYLFTWKNNIDIKKKTVRNGNGKNEIVLFND